MIKRKIKKQQPWSAQSKTPEEVINDALSSLGDDAAVEQFLRTGRKCTIVSALNNACKKKFIEDRSPARTNDPVPFQEEIACTWIELSEALFERFERKITPEHIQNVLEELMPELLEEGMVVKLPNSSYIVTVQGARIGDKYTQTLNDLNTNINTNKK